MAEAGDFAVEGVFGVDVVLAVAFSTPDAGVLTLALADVCIGVLTGTEPLAGVFCNGVLGVFTLPLADASIEGVLAGVAKDSSAFSNFRFRGTCFVAEEGVGVETTSFWCTVDCDPNRWK